MERTRKRPAETQEAAWIADEDKFVLQQAKKKAAIRVKEGRAKPIDWLAVTLRFTDPSRNPFDDEVTDAELDIVDPEGVLEGLDRDQLAELSKDIDMYATLETNKSNLDFWNTMAIICKERRQKFESYGPKGRSQESVSADVDRIFSSKSYGELETLEKQIRTKLRSNEPIDVEYWEGLLRSLISWKARAKLRSVSQAIVDNQLQGLRKQQAEDAERIQKSFSAALQGSVGSNGLFVSENTPKSTMASDSLDPEPLLKICAEDQSLEIRDENVFLQNIASERRKVLKLGYVPLKQTLSSSSLPQFHKPASSKVTAGSSEEFSRATTALYEREVARGVSENEEIFASEEQVSTESKSQWANKYRPRKPRYFNRVQMGYEWNKYNQTHYDHDNPPPKVVQGYKFNIFYPDLIDRAKAPTYKIERENGRKRGQSFAPAGEEDTCLIRFVAGPPYEDVAFRIVDKEWDYSAKRERGFKSSFDKGILQLHFQFKKIFYRK